VASLLLALELALVELVALALSDELVALDSAAEACVEPDADDVEDVDDVESSAEIKSARNVFKSFDNSLRSALRLDDDADESDETSAADEADDDELAEEIVDDDDDDSSAARRFVRSVSSVDNRLDALDDEVEEFDALEDVEEPGGSPGGGPGGGPPAPPGPPDPWLSPPDALLLSCERNASAVADSPTELEASIVDAALVTELDVLAVALD
jgi:hypothetical protein